MAYLGAIVTAIAIYALITLVVVRREFWIARLLGKKITSVEQPTKTDKGCEITGYWYKKRLYVTNMNEIKC